MEGALNLRRSSAEADGHAVFGDVADAEAVTGEPIRQGRYIGEGGTKLGADLSGLEPVMEVRRRGVVLRGDKGVEGGLLLGAAREHQHKVVHPEARTHAAEIVLGICNGQGVAPE